MPPYLNWKYIQAPHVRYSVAALMPRRRAGRLRRVPPPPGTARPRDAARRLPRPIRTTRPACSRCCAGSTARRAPPTPTRSARSRMHEGFRRLLRKSGYYSVRVHDGLRREDQRRRRARRTSTRTERLARDARRFRSGSMTRPRGPRCSSPSTPRATTSGTRRARRHQTFAQHLARSDACTTSSRAHGVRPTYVVTYPVAARSANRRDVLRACSRRRRLRDWRAPSRLGNAPLRAGRRRPACRTRCRCRSRSSTPSSTALTEAIAAGVGRRPVSYRSGRFGFAAAHVSSLERQGYRSIPASTPLFYEAHKGGPTSSARRSRPTSSAYDDADAAGHEQRCSNCPCPAALNRRVPRCGRAAVRRARRGRTSHQAGAAPGPHRVGPLAPPVLQLGGRHDRARPPARRAAGADAQPDLPLERGHRRRQPVQPHRRRAGGVLRSARPVPPFATGDLGARPDDLRGIRRRRSPSAGHHGAVEARPA